MEIRKKLNNSLIRLVDYYSKNYRKMMVIPVVFIIIFGSIILFYDHVNGEFVNEDISLKGGISATVYTNQSVSASTIISSVASQLNQKQASVSILHPPFSTKISGYTVTVGQNANMTKLGDVLSSLFNMKLTSSNYSISYVGSSLAESAIYDSVFLLGIAFVLVAIVSLFYFRNKYQAFSNVISIVSDVINVVGVMDLFNISFSTASIAGILMLMGYSADRNIILATNILKRKEGSIKYRLLHTLRTSLTMDFAAFTTFLILLFGTTNPTIQSIAIVLIIGLIFDDFTVWILNGSIQLYSMKYKPEIESKAI